MAKIREAESVGGLTAEEQKIIAQMRQYIEAKSGGSVGVSDAVGAQAKFDADYRAGRYRAAIDDAELLRKYGALNGTNIEVIAQAYYQMGDFSGCAHFARSNGGGEGMLRLQMTCASEERRRSGNARGAGTARSLHGQARILGPLAANGGARQGACPTIRRSTSTASNS